MIELGSTHPEIRWRAMDFWGDGDGLDGGDDDELLLLLLLQV